MPAEKGALTTLYAATMDVPGNTFIGPDGFKEMIGWPTGVGRSREALDPELARGAVGPVRGADRGALPALAT